MHAELDRYADAEDRLLRSLLKIDLRRMTMIQNEHKRRREMSSVIIVIRVPVR